MAENELPDKYDLTTEINNLSQALSYLLEIDVSVISNLSNQRQLKIARSKRRIIDSISYFCDFLPTNNKEAKDEET